MQSQSFTSFANVKSDMEGERTLLRLGCTWADRAAAPGRWADVTTAGTTGGTTATGTDAAPPARATTAGQTGRPARTTAGIHTSLVQLLTIESAETGLYCRRRSPSPGYYGRGDYGGYRGRSRSFSPRRRYSPRRY